MSDSSYTSFNELLIEFISELSQTFDEYVQLSTASDSLKVLVAIDNTTKIPMDKFFEVFYPYSADIMGKNSNLFKHSSIPFAEEFDIEKEYSESDEATHEAIWGFLQQLFAMATTVKMLPADMMSKIESVANSCMEKVSSGEVSQEDAQSPAYIMQMLNQNPELMSLQQHADSIENK